MYAVCTCTCVRGSSSLATSRRLFSSSRRLLKGEAPAPSSSTSTSTSSSRLEWDSQNKQWTKKPSSTTLKTTPSGSTIRRPTPAERQAILRQLKEQRLNEVTELDASVKPEEIVVTTEKKKDIQNSQQEKADSKDGGSSSSSSSSSSGTAKNVSTSGRRYMRGQDSSSLNIQTAQTLHGVPIPIRPLPPESTDCCMSGCPRCVYDIYTEDLQLHFEAMDKAIKALRQKKVSEEEWPVELKRFAGAARNRSCAEKTSDARSAVERGDGMQSLSDDSDGISAFDIASQVVTDEIQNLDISLRTFLKFERELRQRRKRERATKMALEHVSSMSNSQPTQSASV